MKSESVGFSEPGYNSDKPEKKTLMEKMRNRILTAACLSMAAVLEACGGLTKEDLDKMPLINIEEVIKDPKKFEDIPMIKIEGYPLFLKRNREEFIIPTYNGPNGTFSGYDYITREADRYLVHSTEQPSSPALMGRIVRETETSAFPENPNGNVMDPHKHLMAGKLKRTFTGTEVFFDILKDVDLAPETTKK